MQTLMKNVSNGSLIINTVIKNVFPKNFRCAEIFTFNGMNSFKSSFLVFLPISFSEKNLVYSIINNVNSFHPYWYATKDRSLIFSFLTILF